MLISVQTIDLSIQEYSKRSYEFNHKSCHHSFRNVYESDGMILNRMSQLHLAL